MTKSELSEDQLADRAAFVERVRAAGWDVGGWEQLFENGADLEPEAQAEYVSPRAFLRLSYHARGDYVLLECGGVRGETEGAGEGGVPAGDEPEAEKVRFYPVNDLGAVVGAAAGEKDTLSLENLSELVSKLEPLCNYIILETPEGLKFL
jgi:hypothetical protein